MFLFLIRNKLQVQWQNLIRTSPLSVIYFVVSPPYKKQQNDFMEGLKFPLFNDFFCGGLLCNSQILSCLLQPTEYMTAPSLRLLQSNILFFYSLIVSDLLKGSFELGY